MPSRRFPPPWRAEERRRSRAASAFFWRKTVSVGGCGGVRPHRFGCRVLGDFGDEELIGVEIVKPAARNGDRASAVVALRWMPAPRRPAIRAKGIHPPPWPDPDPSRGIVEHGSGDFARRAWHVPAELPDSDAELCRSRRASCAHVPRQYVWPRSHRRQTRT
jgi:hypothetical protein